MDEIAFQAETAPWWDYIETEPMWSLVAVVLVFLIGASVGVLGAMLYHREDDVHLREGIAVVIVAVWAVATLTQLVVPGYQVSVYVNGLMGAVVGWAFGMTERVKSLVTDTSTTGGDNK